ncbi:hypothetical protein HS088_TW20G00574 [Tripterygium wilfordii]|uniref:Galactose oxidase/kelch repeat superfamily protein n=1 Tax=Tripterygium wilfordii TaxID=458696 RepID=A0A7J7C7W1_TRIWF|nr:host cell factor-like [Tripterygium wilfordii]KAF5730202.1 hypothetical protein HS088_TW20G00574 [Tripterygium wilfordii]
MRWERVQLQQDHGDASRPGKRWGHTCNAVKGGRFLYVFGGYGKDNCQTNQVHVFDTVEQTWSQPVIKGTPPTPRDSHSCTTVGDNLYVFGGTDGKNPLKDLHILNTSTHTWICPSVRSEGPEAREGHSAALVGKRLFIFGGCGKSADTNVEVYFNDVHILNTETFVWKCAMTSGTPPSARDSHTCSSWKNKIVVIGGEDGHDYYLSDVHILDTDTLMWKELSTSGHMLPPRAGHSTVCFGKNLFIFGGFTDAQNLYDDLYMLDIDSGLWTKVLTTGDGPSARFSVAGDCLDPLKGGVLVFIGGCNEILEALDDMHYLHTGLTCARDERRPEKLSLRKQLKLKCQEQNLTPMPDKALTRIENNPDVRHPMIFMGYGQPGRENLPLNQVHPLQGKKTFQAKVTESLPHGYTVETYIDGKPLRGILFANSPSSPDLANYNSSRKRAGEFGGVVLNGDHSCKSKASRTLQLDSLKHKQIDSQLGKDSSLQEPKADASAAAQDLKNLAPSNNGSRLHQVPTRPESSVAPSLNLNEVRENATVSTTKVLKEHSNTLPDPITSSFSHDDTPATLGDQNTPAKSV